jgi:hypothetical protein
MIPTRLARFFGRSAGNAERFLLEAPGPPAFLATSLTRFLGTTGTESSESESELSESELSESDSYLSMWLGTRTTCLMASPLLRALWNAPEHPQSYGTGPTIPQAEHGPISKSATFSLPGPNLIGFWQANLSGPWYVRLSMLFAGLTEGNPMCRARPETPARMPKGDAGEELCGESSPPVCSEWLPAFVSGTAAAAFECMAAACDCTAAACASTATCECTATCELEWLSSLAAFPFGASSAATAWS